VSANTILASTIESRPPTSITKPNCIIGLALTRLSHAPLKLKCYAAAKFPSRIINANNSNNVDNSNALRAHKEERTRLVGARKAARYERRTPMKPQMVTWQLQDIVADDVIVDGGIGTASI